MEDDDKEKLKKANDKASFLNKKLEYLEAQIEWFKEMEEKYNSDKAKLEKL